MFEEEEERPNKTICSFCECLVWYFMMVFCDTGSLVGHEDTRRRMVHGYKGLQVFAVFEILREFFVLACIASTSYPSLHIKSTDPMIKCYFSQEK